MLENCMEVIARTTYGGDGDRELGAEVVDLGHEPIMGHLKLGLQIMRDAMEIRKANVENLESTGSVADSSWGQHPSHYYS